MYDLGNLTYFLGIEFERIHKVLWFIKGSVHYMLWRSLRCWIANQFQLQLTHEWNFLFINDEKEVDLTLFKKIVGSLRYFYHIRPDIAYEVGLISKYMEKPTTSHMIAANRILRYVKGTCNYGIQYSRNQNSLDPLIIKNQNSILIQKHCCLCVYDWQCCIFMESEEGVSGCIVFLWSWVYWSFYDSLSSSMDQYVTNGIEKLKKNERMEMMVDSKSVINLVKHLVAHEWSKHIETRFYILKDQVNKGKLGRNTRVTSREQFYHQ